MAERLALLPPEHPDDAADRYIAAGGTEHSRAERRKLLLRVAPLVARVPTLVLPKRIGQRGLPLRIAAIPWSRVTPELAAQVCQQLVDSSPTLKRASAVLGALRGVLRLALRDQPGLLASCLESLRVDGISAERAEQSFWFEYEGEPESNLEVVEHVDGVACGVV